MERTTFLYLVMAIVALAVLGIFLLQFAGLFELRLDPEDTVKKELNEAEADLGHFKAQSGFFEREHTVQAMAFENSNRSIVFECNSPVLCCGEGEKCDKAIEWSNQSDTRYFSFNQSKDIMVSSRCRHEELYICRVYLGEEPAQVEIKEINFENEELNLAENTKFSIGFETENIGAQDILTAKAKAAVYKIVSRNGTETERKPVEEFSVDFPLAAGKQHADEIELEITENGDYEIEVIIEEEGDETNYEKQVFELNAFGATDAGTCTAGELKVQELEKCVYLLPCKCKSIVECEKIWREALDLSIEDKFELMSSDDEKEEITLKYEAEYNIPDFCDPEEMDCEGYCVEQPEPECRTRPCVEDILNCRIWLECDCDTGADFSKCEQAWREQLPGRTLQKGTRNGKTALFVPGTIKQIPHEICGPCGDKVKSWIDCCELPQVLNCGGNQCEEPEQPTPTPTPTPPAQPVCEDGTPQTLNCIQNNLECDLMFVCECLSFDQCKQDWLKKLNTEWGYNMPNFQDPSKVYEDNLNGKMVVRVDGRMCEEDCAVPGCQQQVFGLETRCNQIG